MATFARAFAILVIYVGTCICWAVLGGSMQLRTSGQKQQLEGKVNSLWGRPQAQHAPELWLTPLGKEPPAGQPPSPESFREPWSARVNVDLGLDQRLKGLTWYSLYDVGFDAAWTYQHDDKEPATLNVAVALPDAEGVYDGFQFVVNDQAVEAQPVAGRLATRVEVSPGEVVTIGLAYKSRGLDAWTYVPSRSGRVQRLDLSLKTNFANVDFPENGLSPSKIQDEGDGKALAWGFENILSKQHIGVTMPQRIQPGQLASQLSFTAPISLLFFFLVIAVLAKLEKLDIHPVNYAFLGASFFAFHLLFAYLVDHVGLAFAFAASSLTSVAMVTTYLRLVVSARFGFIKAGLAQLIYLVGFGLAHFIDGFTGLTITVLSIGTLFLLMMLTGKIRWTEVLAPIVTSPPAPMPPQQPQPFPASMMR